VTGVRASLTTLRETEPEKKRAIAVLWLRDTGKQRARSARLRPAGVGDTRDVWNNSEGGGLNDPSTARGRIARGGSR
jgi:hypothetical protein